MIQTGTIAAVAVAFAKYTGVFFPSISRPELTWHGRRQDRAHHAATAGHRRDRVAHLVNTRGIRTGAMVQNVFTFAKVGVAAGAGRRGLSAGPQSRRPWPATSRISGAAPGGISIAVRLVGVAMVGPLFSSDAWNNVTFTAGEVRNPKRNLPLSLALGVGIVSALYIACNFVYLNVLTFDAIQHAAKIASPPRLRPSCSARSRCR